MPPPCKTNFFMVPLLLPWRLATRLADGLRLGRAVVRRGGEHLVDDLARRLGPPDRAATKADPAQRPRRSDPGCPDDTAAHQTSRPWCLVRCIAPEAKPAGSVPRASAARAAEPIGTVLPVTSKQTVQTRDFPLWAVSLGDTDDDGFAPAYPPCDTRAHGRACESAGMAGEPSRSRDGRLRRPCVPQCSKAVTELEAESGPASPVVRFERASKHAHRDASGATSRTTCQGWSKTGPLTPGRKLGHSRRVENWAT